MKDNTYFDTTVEADGISGDDVNRHLREKRLGFKAPSDDWFLAGAPIHCIYKGQVPTKTLHDVVLFNFLPLAIIGFIATDDFGPVVPDETPNVTVINPVIECEPGPPTTEAECDKLIGMHLCPGCDVMEGKCPDLCVDPPTVEDLEDKACENCLHIKVPLYAEPCDGCFDREHWKGMPVMEEAPTPCADQAESLYRAGCWVALENRKHDLMSEWSMAAPDCQFQFEAEDRDELLCSHDNHSLFPCHFDECPRMKA